MTNIRAKGFESPSHLQEQLDELDEERAISKNRPAPAAEGKKSAEQEIAALRAEIAELKAKLSTIHAQTEGVGAPVAESDVRPWLRIAATVATTYLLGRIVQRLRLGASGAAAVPMIAAQLDRRFW
ncbi:hypothetical protein [Rhizobium sp.]|uniref:hypothetical protein n=1 Tax=Rhizobium sp. TaxID=391 RepID=UPI0028A9B694